MRQVLALVMLAVSTMAAAEPVDPMAALTGEVMDLYVYEPICGYRIDRGKLDFYLLGTPMFWGEPVSQGEIDGARAREVALIGGNAYAKTKKCRSVGDNFGPTGLRARGIVR